jgi:hypothetical protein
VGLRYACEWLNRYDSNRGANAFQANHRQHIRERRSRRRRHGSSGAGYKNHAYVFVKPVAGWTNENETAELSPTDAVTFDQFGFSVAIRGKTVVVGKPSLTNSGGAYVFVELPGGWTNMTRAAKLSASGGTPNDYFGSSAFTNGNLALVGAMFATVGSTYQKGAAYVVVKPAKAWKPTSKFNQRVIAKDKAAKLVRSLRIYEREDSSHRGTSYQSRYEPESGRRVRVFGQR